MSQDYCTEGDRCVCGGDTDAVRATCRNWRAAPQESGSPSLPRHDGYTAELSTFAVFDDEGLLEPKKPYSWETLARVAIDLANARLCAAQPPQAAPKAEAPAAPAKAGEAAAVALADADSAFVNLTYKLPSGDFDAELLADALNRLRAALAAPAAAPSAPSAQPVAVPDDGSAP